MKTLFSNSKKWLIFRYLCLIYLFLCGLALIWAFILEKAGLPSLMVMGSFLWLPIFTLVFLTYCIIIAIRTKLKMPRSKWLIGICAFVIIATLLWFLIEISRFDYDNHEIFNLFDDYMWASLWFGYSFVFHIVLLLYVLAFNVYSLCTNFSLKGSKVYFFVSVASVVLLLCIGGVAYFNNSKDNNPSVESDCQVEEIEQSLSEEEAFEQMLDELDSLGRTQDNIDIIPDFDEIVIQSE